MATLVFTSDTKNWLYKKANGLQEGDFIYYLGDCYSLASVKRSGHNVRIEGESDMFHTLTVIYLSSGDSIRTAI